MPRLPPPVGEPLWTGEPLPPGTRVGFDSPTLDTAVLLAAWLCAVAAILLMIDTFWWSWDHGEQHPPVTTSMIYEQTTND